MPKISEMIESKYLKKDDIDDDVIVTIVGVKQANIAREDQPPDYKWLIKFKEFEKPMVLNSTNIQLCAKACGSDEANDWKGKEIILYVDDNVSFQGKLVGGLRLKAIKQNARPARAAAAPSGDDGWGEEPKAQPAVSADDIPF